jgi:cysteine sulfinate desulfinase/cysteine desulfurase-like protein
MLQELPRFVVERRVPTMTATELAGLHSALTEAAQRLSAESEHVTCMRTFYVPSLERWMAVFEAETPDPVHRAAKIAQVSPGDVHQAVEMTETSER